MGDLPRLKVELNPKHKDFSVVFEMMTELKKLLIDRNVAILVVGHNPNLGSLKLIYVVGEEEMESINEIRTYLSKFITSLGHRPEIIDPAFQTKE